MTSYVLSGTTSSGIVLQSGDTLVVSSGGFASSTTISSGGVETVYAGSKDDSSSVRFGGTITLSSGASGTNIGVVSGLLVVSSGGVATNTRMAGGEIDVYAGGRLNQTDIVGNLYVFSDATVTSTTVDSGGTERVFSGAVSSKAYVSNINGQILSGGTAISSTVFTGASIRVSSGGELLSAVGSGGQINVESGGKVDNATLRNHSTIYLSSGAGAAGTTLSNGSVNVLNLGVATSTTVMGGASESVQSGGQSFGAHVLSGGILFAASGGAIYSARLDSGATESINSGGLLLGTTLSIGSFVDLRQMAVDASGTVTLDSATDVLTVTEGGQTFTGKLLGDYTGEYFHLAVDSGSGTLITLDTVACYCANTRIQTARGQRLVERLAIGDLIVTASKKRRLIKWIGRRSYAGRFLAANPGVQPVRFRAGSLDCGLPQRDLLVSPDHAMFLDGLLIPAKCLVNGSSIVQECGLERVDYVHIELETHDLLLAEGAPSESFLDDESRGLFHNAHEFSALYPDAARRVGFCAPRIEHGAQLEAVRQRLGMVAGKIARRSSWPADAVKGATAPATTTQR